MILLLGIFALIHTWWKIIAIIVRVDLIIVDSKWFVSAPHVNTTDPVSSHYTSADAIILAVTMISIWNVPVHLAV